MDVSWNVYKFYALVVDNIRAAVFYGSFIESFIFL